MGRERFLARVAASLASADLPEPDVAAPLPLREAADLVGSFRARAEAVNALVHGPVSHSGVSAVVAAIAAEHTAATFMAWDDLAVPGVQATLAGAGLTRIEVEVPRDATRRDRVSAWRQVDLGITGADVGLAESGSVVLVHGPGRPRLASLIPEAHVAILDVEDITSSLAHWAGQEASRLTETANLVVVTGPSRSGDIELELNLGVHGPRHVHVVLIDRWA